MDQVFRKNWLMVGAVSAGLLLSGCASTATSSSNSPAGGTPPAPEVAEPQTTVEVRRNLSHVTRSGEIYLMRGLLNIFSRGMDTMAGRMRGRGLDAISFNHANWRPYADDIIARAKRKEVSYPIVIMGHSLGGNEAPRMANYLAANGVSTKLIVAFDPTEPQVVGPRIETVINYYLPNGRNTIRRASGFKGTLANVDMSGNPDIEHTTIEKNAGLQNKSISRVMELTRKLSKRQISKLQERSGNRAS